MEALEACASCDKGRKGKLERIIAKVLGEKIFHEIFFEDIAIVHDL